MTSRPAAYFSLLALGVAIVALAVAIVILVTEAPHERVKDANAAGLKN